MKIGIIADTHGLLQSSLLDILKDCDYILHAGDIGSKACYDKLKALDIPLYMIRGNCDRGEWARFLPETLAAPVGGRIFYLIHDRSQLSYPFPDADFIISGHTHHYALSKRGGTTYLNPGSSGSARSSSLPSMALLETDDNGLKITRIML